MNKNLLKKMIGFVGVASASALLSFPAMASSDLILAQRGQGMPGSGTSASPDTNRPSSGTMNNTSPADSGTGVYNRDDTNRTETGTVDNTDPNRVNRTGTGTMDNVDRPASGTMNNTNKPGNRTNGSMTTPRSDNRMNNSTQPGSTSGSDVNGQTNFDNSTGNNSGTVQGLW